MGLALEYQYKNTTLTSKGIRKYLILKQLCVQWPNNTQSPLQKKLQLKYANETERRKFSIKTFLKAFGGNIRRDDVSK